ncbi:hypothetical protein [Thalassotalea piscium]|uniref:DUF2189 domain-containing protein n=1 Tax=Thalassotalea piscium TaxID=1230533 RepID=A0A7X0NII1_9GAMM|nr:hypothetical protein [Thalassotalea piscium]MBB6543980.1 hypothetical protein [Thalassotalea piscium]
MIEDKPTGRQINFSHLLSYLLLMLSTLGIYVISEVIRFYLIAYELNSMFISFCVGFILFTPLISLLLHPLLFSKESLKQRSPFSIMLKNIGLVMVIQCLFFLIWITDAVAVYSIYVDQDSFLAKAFNITKDNRADLTSHFYWGNLLLAWFFSLLSLVIGVLPCLIAQLNNQGVVKNFVMAISFAKKNKSLFALYACVIALATVMPLLYAHYLFVITFPITLFIIFFHLFRRYRIGI